MALLVCRRFVRYATTISPLEATKRISTSAETHGTRFGIAADRSAGAWRPTCWRAGSSAGLSPRDFRQPLAHGCRAAALFRRSAVVRLRARIVDRFAARSSSCGDGAALPLDWRRARAVRAAPFVGQTGTDDGVSADCGVDVERQHVSGDHQRRRSKRRRRAARACKSAPIGRCSTTRPIWLMRHNSPAAPERSCPQ